MASGPARTRGVVRILDRYQVDVVGLQEFQRPQAIAFSRLAGSSYAIWHPPGESPENSIAFRRDRWPLAGADSIVVPYFNGHTRRMPVVRLRDRVSGADVTFLNVHNPADIGGFQGRWRYAAVTHEISLVRNLSSGGSPVIMTGDLNDRRHAFCRLASAGGLASSNGGTGSPCAPARHSGIDWILGSRSIQFSDHTVDRDQLVHRTTDHPVVIARARVAP
jgi:endonuclease/exonuclease/phosphatase family metal-dependent hydrolase